MKKLIYLLIIVIGTGLLLPSCDKDQEGSTYIPSDFENGLTFQVATSSVAIQPEDPESLTISVYRINPTGSFSANFDVTISDENVFSTSTASVNFAVGETETNIVIDFDYETMQFNTDYVIDIELSTESKNYIPEHTLNGTTVAAAKKLITTTKLNVTKALTWTNIGKVYWISEWWEDEGLRNIWRADQIEAYRVEDIFFVDNGKMFEFTVAADGSISAVPSQEIWFYSSYSAWVCAENISGTKVGNTFNILVGRYYMPNVGGWNGPWKETGILQD